MKVELFKKTEKLIYARAWSYARKYNMDFEDLKSEAFEIFCEAVNRFNPAKGSFTTFLFHRLRTLNDYCKREVDYKRNEPQALLRCHQRVQANEQEGVFDIFTDEPLEASSPADRILFYQLAEKLSEDSRQVLAGLVYGLFHDPTKERAHDIGKWRIHEVCSKEWGWAGSRAERVWNELCSWWGENEAVLASV